MTLSRLSRYFIRGVNYLTGKNRRMMPVEGLPDGMEFEILNKLCLHHLGDPLKHVFNYHISSWKAAGSYRLFLQTKNGYQWNLIYKNAIYRQDHIPALAELPINPGPPEYIVYSNNKGALAEYLPTVYLCLEVVPGQHYKYLLEDMENEYQKSLNTDAILAVATKLTTFHRVLNEWSLSVNQDFLLRYGSNFSNALLDYVKINLERYARTSLNKIAFEIYKLSPQISEIFEWKAFKEHHNLCPIHGDFNPSNILTNKQNPFQMKLIDWEWAGLGMVHADLASLLARTSPKIEQQALLIFSKRDDHLSLDEHKRLYQCCKLQRHLLDAAFLAAQQLGSKTLNRFNKIIDASMRRALQAYRELLYD